MHGAERVDVGRVVAGIERASQAARGDEGAHGGALVGVDRRTQLEHLASEACVEALGARAARDVVEEASAASWSVAVRQWKETVTPLSSTGQSTVAANALSRPAHAAASGASSRPCEPM